MSMTAWWPGVFGIGIVERRDTIWTFVDAGPETARPDRDVDDRVKNNTECPSGGTTPMGRHRIAVAAGLLPLILVLAACSGAATTGPTTQPASQAVPPSTVYTFTQDVKDSGKSNCTGGCATTWPPLTVTGTPTAGTGVTGKLATITRDDGSTQVTYNGLPLYFFSGDTAPGDGKGVYTNWEAVAP
jgi:predicted lipoprotein with Yx(FWY)xxD motif